MKVDKDFALYYNVSVNRRGLDASSGGTLVIAGTAILRDVAYRERVRKQVSSLMRIGPVMLLVFGFGTSEEARILKTRYRLPALESIEFFLSPRVPVLGQLFYLFAALRARSAVRKIVKKGRASRVHVENLPAFLPLLGTGARRRARVVLDYHGLVPEEVREKKGKLSGCILFILLKRLEKRALRTCHGIICVSHPFREYLVTELGVPGDRILVLQNSIETSFAPRPESRNYYRRLYGLEEKFVIVYCGSLMPHQCPDAMASLFRSVRAKVPEACLVLFTHDQNGLKHFLLKHGPFHGEVTYMRLERDDVPHYLSIGDLALLLREENLAARVSSPIKFPEYLACGLPVVVSPGLGHATEIVERTGLGVVVSTGNLEDGARKIVEFILASRSTMGELRERCRKAAFDLFTAPDEGALVGFYAARESGGGG